MRGIFVPVPVVGLGVDKFVGNGFKKDIGLGGFSESNFASRPDMYFDWKAVADKGAHGLYFLMSLKFDDFIGGEPFVVFSEVGEGTALDFLVKGEEISRWLAFIQDLSGIDKELHGSQQQNRAHEAS